MLERSLSENSIEAYLRDVNKLYSFLELHELQLSPTEVQQQHLEDFILWLKGRWVSAPTQTRPFKGRNALYKKIFF